MIPGLTGNALDALSRLPSVYDRSTPNPLRELVASGLKNAVYLLVARPYDPVTGREELVTLATSSYGSHGTPVTLIDGAVIPAHRLFRSRLKDAYNVSINMLQGASGTASTAPTFGQQDVIPTSGVVTINLGDGSLDKLLRFSWPGRPIMILVGDRKQPLTEFSPIFIGTCDEPTWDNSFLNLPIQDPSAMLNVALQKTLYLGYGNCIRLNGTSDYIASASTFAASTNVTFEMRFRCRGANGAGVDQILAAHGSGWSSSTLDWYLKIAQSTGYLSVTCHRSSGTAAGVSTNFSVRDWKWHHVAIVIVPGTGLARLYLDGVLIGTFTAPALTATTGKLWIGSLVGATSNFSRVDVDDIRIWNISRSASDINAYRDATLAGTESGLRFYWQCEEGTGTVVQDSTVANLDGTLTGGLWIGSGEGGSDLKGKPKPLWYGWREQVEPVWVDSLRNVFQAHDTTMQGLTHAYDKGNGTALVHDGDVADGEALYTTTPAAGHWISCNSLGMGRTGAKPDGVLTLDGDGDNTGGVYASTIADIFRRMAERHVGYSYPANFDIGALAAANALVPGAWGWGIGLDTTNINEAFSDLVSPLMVWGYTRMSQLTLFAPAAPGTPVATFTDRDLKVNKITSVPVPISPSSVKTGYRRYALTQTSDALSAGISEQQRQDLGEQYRYTLSTDDAVLGRSVKERYAMADVMTIETAFKLEADAKAQGDRWLSVFQDCVAFDIPLIKGLFQYKIGDTVAFNLSRILTGNVPMVIVGYVENVGSNDIHLIVWGPRVIVEESCLNASKEDALSWGVEDAFYA